MSYWIFPPVEPELAAPRFDFWDNLVVLWVLAAGAVALALICFAFKKRR